MHKANFSKELLSRAKLLKAKDFNFNENSTSSILIDIFSLSKSENNKIILNNAGEKNRETSKNEGSNIFNELNINLTQKENKNEEKKINNEDADLFQDLKIRGPVKKEIIKNLQPNSNLNKSSKKFYKDGNITLDNFFFSDFFSGIGKKQSEYDEEFIDSLLNV